MTRRNSSKSRKTSRKLPQSALRVEQLEDRVVPAVVFRIGYQTIPEPAVAQGIVGTLNPGTSTDAYHFQGLAGDRLTFDWLTGTDGHWQLFAPMSASNTSGETQLFSHNFGTDETLTLPVAGAYTLIVAGTDATVGATTPYSFRVLDTSEPFAPTAGTGGFSLNAVTTGTLTDSGATQEQTFTFTATAGRVLYVDNQTTTNNGSVRTTITAPDGTTVIDSYYGTGDIGTFVAPRSGTYTLRQRNDAGVGAGDRTFTFNLLDLDGAGATVYTPGTAATVTLPDIQAAQFFRLPGTAGEQLVYDGLNTNSSQYGYMYLYGPGGSFTGYATTAYGDAAPYTETETGSYYLRIEGQGYGTQYAFRALSVAAAPALSFAATTSGTLTPDSSKDIYRFSATAGDRFALDALTPASGIYYQAWGPNNQVVFNAGGDGVFTAPQTGDYTLHVIGQGAGNAASTLAYSFRAHRSPQTATAYALGTAVTGTIATPGQVDTYTFAGTAGQRLAFDSLSVGAFDYPSHVQLLSPSGADTSGWYYTSQDRSPITLTETGTYTLRVSRDATATGPYAFRVLDVAAATPLLFGTATTGDLAAGLTTGRGAKLYTFDVTPPQLTAGGGTVRFSYAGTAGSGSAYLYGPNDAGIAGTSLASYFQATLTTPGTYVLSLTGDLDAAPNAFSFTAAKPVTTTTAYTLGTVAAGTLSVYGQVDTYTFAGTAGQRVAFDALETGTLGYDRMQVVSPSGADTSGWYYTSQDYGPETLTETGTYTLRVFRDDVTTAPYAFRVLDAAAATPLLFGTATTGDLAAGLTTGRGAKLYTFDVTPPQLTAGGGTVRFSYAGTAGSGSAYLYGPNDAGIAGTSLASYFQATLTTPGTYVLSLTGDLDAAPNAFSFTAAKPVTTTTAYALGTAITGTLSVLGQVDTYTFAGTAGQRIALDALTTGDAGTYARVEVISPSGANAAGGWYWTFQDGPPETLTETGAYTVRVFFDSPPAPQTYRFRVLDVAVAATSSTFGTPTTGDLNDGAVSGRADRLYTFTLTAGDLVAGPVRVSFAGTAGTGTAYLYGPDDAGITATSLAGYVQATLTAPGTYVLALHGSKPTADNAFSFTAAKPLTTTAAYALGATISGNLTVFGQLDRYTFAGTVGQRLVLDALDNPISNHSVRLIAPSGFVVFERNVSYDTNPVTLPEAGTYRLEVFRNDPTPGAYTLRVLDASSALSLSVAAGGASYGTPLNPRESSVVYRLAGAAGQSLTISGMSPGNNTGTYTVYDSYDRYLSQFALSDAGPHTTFLPETGTYLFVLSGTGGTGPSTPVTFTAEVTSPVATALSGFGTLLTATLANSGGNGQTTTFTFTAPAGRVVYLDNQSTNAGSVRFTLTAPAAGGNPFDTYSGTGDSGPVVLPTSGTYTLTVRNDAGADVSRSVAFKLLDLDAAPAYAVGTTVSDTFTAAGEARVYRVTGTLGQRLFYDGTNTGTVAYPSLYGPGALKYGAGLYNQSLLNGNSATLDYGPFQLSQAGTHYLVVNHDSGSLAYGFRLLDRAAAPALSFAATTTGTLDPGSQADLYRFNATAGDAISIDWLTGTSGQYDLYGPSNGYVTAIGFGGDQQNITLPATGEYTFVVRGASSGSQTYSFRAYQVPATTTVPLTLGATLSDSTSVPGQSREYTFTGVAGQRLYYDGLSADSGQTFTVQLLDPNGASVSIYGHNLISDVGPFTLARAGTYTLRVVGQGNSVGAYSFRLIDTQDTVNGPAEVLPFGPATSFGATFSVGTESAVFTFTATAGDRIFLEGLTGANYGGLAYMYGPNNQNVGGYYTGTSFNYLFEPLSATGTYTLVVSGLGTAGYTFTQRATKPLVIDNGALTFGAVTSGTIAEPGERQTYTFTGTLGQVLNFDGLAADDTLYVTLTDPSGAIVFLNTSYVASDFNPFTLTAAGTYTLTVGANGSGADIGAFSFRLIDRAQAPATVLSTAAITTGNLPTGREMDVYRLTGVAGQRLFIDWLTVDNTYQGLYYLFGPGHQHVSAQYFGFDFDSVLPTSGEYTLQLRGNVTPAAAYGYSFRAYLAATTTTAYTLGTPAAGTLVNPGDYHEYIFPGTAGQKLVFDGLSGAGLVVQFLNPTGGVVWFSGNAVTSDSGPYTLLQAGTYRLRVFGGSNDDAVGAYSFNLIDRAAAPALALSFAATTDVTLAANQTAVYRFTGTKGQRYFFDALGSTATGSVSLYGPNDNYVNAVGSLTENFQGVFPSDGPYTLIVYGTATGGTFSFRASLPPTTTTALTLGATVNGTLSEAGEIDEYTFTGVAGQRVFFDGQGGAAGLSVQLFSPTRNLEPALNGVSFLQDNQSPVVLAVAGTWTLRVSASDAQTGPYRFRLLDPAITPDVLPAHFFSVYVDAPDAAASSVQFATADGKGSNPAVAGVDYQARSRTVYLNPGETSKLVRVNVLTNPALRGTATYSVTLSTPANGSLGTPAATGSIVGPAQLPVGVAFVVQPADTVAGTTLTAVTVRILDDAGNTVTGFTGPVTISLQNNPGGGTLSGTLTVDAVNGVATFSTLSLDRSGTAYRFAAASAGLPAVTSTNFAVTAAAASKLAVGTGPSNVVAGVAIAPAVTVLVQDQFGNTVTTSSASVTVVLNGGPTMFGTLTVNAVNGVATFGTLSVQAVGTYTLTASTTGLTAATTGNFTVTAAAASKLAFGTGPSNVSAGVAIAPAVTVLVQDQFGNTVTTSSASVTVVASGAGFSGTSTTSATASGGVATFSNLRLNTAGAYTISAGVTGLTGVTSAAFTVGPAVAAALGFTTQPPAAATAGAGFDVAVSVLDGLGNLVTTSTAAVTLVLQANPGGSTLGGTLTVTAVNGVATFAGLSLNKAATGYTLRATTAGLALADSAAFAVNAAAPAALTFLQGPTNMGAGSGSFTPGIVVQVVDAFQNPVAASTAPVTLVLTGPGGFPFGPFTVNALNGVANFGGNTTIRAAGVYTLSASSPGLTNVPPVGFTVAPGPLFGMDFVQNPTASSAGAPINPAVTVTLNDFFGNRTSGSGVPVTMTVFTGPGGFTAGSTVTVNSVAGLATFPDLALRTTGQYVLRATSPNGVELFRSSVSVAFNVVPAVATKVAFGAQPTPAVAGAALAPAVTVLVQDQFGNTDTTSSAVVTLTIGNNAGGSTLGGTLSVSAVDGVATFSTLSLNKSGTGYTLAAASTSLTGAVSAGFAVTAAAPSQLAVGQQPTNVLAGAAIAPAVTVRILDAFGNPTTSSAMVTLSAGGSSLGGTVSVAADNGVATFADLTVATVGTYSLTATSGSLTGVTSSSFQVSAAAAGSIAFGQQPPATGTAGLALSPAVTVRVLDAGGNLATGFTGAVTVTVPGGFAAGSTATVNAVAGVATFGDLTLTAAGAYELTATAGLLAATSTGFSVVAGAAAGLAFQVQPSDAAAGVALSPVVRVRVVDAFGNTVTGSSAAVTVALGVNPGGGLLGGTTTVAAEGGVATFTGLSVNRLGVGYTLAATAGSSTVASAGFTIAANLAAAPTVLSTLVNGRADDGSLASRQRSMVTSVQVTFSGLVVLDAGAVTMTRTRDGVAVGLSVVSQQVGGNTVVTLAFTTGGATYALTTGGFALTDGLYGLRIDASKVRAAGTNLWLNGDGAGGNYAFGADPADRFWRLFGDVDGNGKVDGNDLFYYRQAFGVGQAANVDLRSLFDFDGNGVLDATDTAQFKLRFGRAVR